MDDFTKLLVFTRRVASFSTDEAARVEARKLLAGLAPQPEGPPRLKPIPVAERQGD